MEKLMADPFVLPPLAPVQLVKKNEGLIAENWEWGEPVENTAIMLKLQHKKDSTKGPTMNEKPISCGFLVLNSKNEILACHPTGAAFNEGCWNVPKGVKDENDKLDLITAVRELKEETNLEYDVDVDFVYDAERMPYLKNKDIHLFVARAKIGESYISKSQDEFMSKVFCCSTFKNDRGFWVQEMDAFTFTSDINMFNKGLRQVIQKIMDELSNKQGAKQ
jgi:ADP-ribose pyrophosphatase YjhB (NUDIX family)